MRNLNPPSPGYPSPNPAKAGKRSCNCRNSRCLKLYCECFSQGEYCNNCNCLNCHNTALNESFRKEAIAGILERNPLAFRPRISPLSQSNTWQDRRSKGCACRRTGCLKKYCECYQAGLNCSEVCKCIECKNECTDLKSCDLPVKRIIFKPENLILDNEVIKGFFDGVFKTKIEPKASQGDDVSLICDEEILASEVCESPVTDSPRKKVFTFSSEYKKLEFSIYEQLIVALLKTYD